MLHEWYYRTTWAAWHLFHCPICTLSPVIFLELTCTAPLRFILNSQKLVLSWRDKELQTHTYSQSHKAWLAEADVCADGLFQACGIKYERCNCISDPQTCRQSRILCEFTCTVHAESKAIMHHVFYHSKCFTAHLGDDKMYCTFKCCCFQWLNYP